MSEFVLVPERMEQSSSSCVVFSDIDLTELQSCLCMELVDAESEWVSSVVEQEEAASMSVVRDAFAASRHT